MRIGSTAQEIVLRLQVIGLSNREIADNLGNRVSPRTVHRWSVGKSQPGNSSDFEVLCALLGRMETTVEPVEPVEPSPTPVEPV